MSSIQPRPQTPLRRRATRLHRPRGEARIVVRPLNRTDFFGWHDAFAEHLREHGGVLTETHALRVWQWLESTPARLEAIVAEVGERVCGLLHFQETVVPASGEVHLVVLDLYAAPDVRMRGAADDLVAELHAIAEGRGVDRICTHTSTGDAASLRYWDRVGDRAEVIAFDMPVRARA